MYSLVIENKLKQLQKSKFRGKFHLRNDDKNYIKNKGMQVIERHAYDFVKTRLSASNLKDGKQTPMKGHPVFIAQHATATCCRGCIAKWHKIDRHKELSNKDISFIVALIMEWIKKDLDS